MGIAVYLLARGVPPEPTFSSFLDWLREGLLAAYLVASAAAVEGLRRAGIAGARPVRAIQAGYGLILVGVLASVVLRDDPEWFVVVGLPGNLLASVGFAVLGVTTYRRRTLPGWAAALLGVGGFFAILFAELGTSVLIGSFWLYAAARLLRPWGAGGAARGEPMSA